jgi:SAM-dependent methyltransferase
MTPQADLPIAGSPAEIYEQFMVRAIFGPWAKDFVDFVALKSGQSALDIACGTGALTGLLADRAGGSGRVAGLDFDSAMIDVARSRRPDIEWHDANALQMPFSDGEFDIAASQQGFQFLPDKKVGLLEIRRVLKPHGRLALSVWRSLEFSPGFHALSKALAKWVNPDVAKLGAFSQGDPDTLRELIGDAGFVNVKIHAVSKTVHFGSASRFAELVIAGSSAMTRKALSEISATDIEAFKNDVVEMLSSYESSAGLTLPTETHYIGAERP